MDPGEQRSARPHLRIHVTDAQGRAIEPGLSRWLAHVAPLRARGRVSVAIVSDQRMRSLNRVYRGVDAPTDVLSFPTNSPPRRTRRTPRTNFDLSKNSSASSVSGSVESLVGEIVIAQGMARRQARRL